jgi:hypothetical protein
MGYEPALAALDLHCLTGIPLGPLGLLVFETHCLDFWGTPARHTFFDLAAV